MKNKFFKSLMVGLCCSFLFATGSFASSLVNTSPVITSTDFEEKVIQNDKLVVVDFYSPMCGPCSIMTLNIDSISGQYNEKVAFYSVNVHEQPDLVEKYDIWCTPTIILFKDGNKVDTSIGLIEPEDLKELIDFNLNTSAIAKTIIKKSIGDDTISVIAKLGNEFGENAGYYTLDVNNSFDETDNIKEEPFSFVETMMKDNQLQICSCNEGSCLCSTFNLDTTLLNPSNVSKETKNDKDYLVLEDNGKKLYFEKINNCYALDENGVALCSDKFVKAYMDFCDSNPRNQYFFWGSDQNQDIF